MKDFLKWLFLANGVVATEAPPKVMFRVGTWGVAYNPKPFRPYRPNGLTMQEMHYYHLLKRNVRFFHCKVCGVGCWGYRQQRYCGSWSCYKG